MAGYILSPRAVSDLDEIWNYTAATWDTEQAEIYIRELWRAIETVAADPGRGRACDEIRPGYFKFLSGSHVLFYRKATKKIDIVRILHQRMDFDVHL